mgnify:CR=1 FL=1
MHMTSAQSTPYSLLYGVEVVIQVDIQIQSLHIVIQKGLSEDKDHKLYLAELEVLDGKRLQAK